MSQSVPICVSLLKGRETGQEEGEGREGRKDRTKLKPLENKYGPMDAQPSSGGPVSSAQDTRKGE